MAQRVKKFKYMTPDGLSNEIYFAVNGENIELSSGETLEELISKLYLKDETFSREEVLDLIDKMPKMKYIKVDELPTEDIDTECIYLVPNNSEDEENMFTEYLYINGEWEIFGINKIELENYYTKEDIDNKHFISNSNVEDGKIVFGESENEVDEIKVITSDGEKTVAYQEELVEASTTIPLVAGVAVSGTEDKYARGDHVHPEQVNITGNAATAHKLLVAKDIELTGGVTGSVSFDGSQNVEIETTVVNATDTVVGGMKARYDETTNTLYLTTDGTDA